MRRDDTILRRAIVEAFDLWHVAAAAIDSLFGCVIRSNDFFRRARLLPFIVSGKSANMLIPIELSRRIDLVTGRAEFRLAQQWPHHRALVSGNIRENLLVGEVTEDRSAVLFCQQGGPANRKAAGAFQPRGCD